MSLQELIYTIISIHRLKVLLLFLIVVKQQGSSADIFGTGTKFLTLESKRRKTQWKQTKIKALTYNPYSTLFELDSNYLADSGLPSDKLILYCRPTFHYQFTFLRERVINNSRLGWILGPPGTGKSTTALSFASTLIGD